MLSPIQEIKDRLDIVEFIRSYIPLLAAGKNFKANCPFHKEKTPSFIVSSERQTWHCFGACSEGGDIFKFLMKIENLEFYEALKFLAEKAGIELKKINPIEYKQSGILYEINEAAKIFFKKGLEQSNEVLKYLLERGLKKETIEEFELGFSQNNYDDLTRHLINSGFDVKDIEKSGLNFKTDRGNYIDRFRGRIIFPLNDYFGKTIGFSGRIMPQFETPEIGKYVNSPETPIFNKSKLLYGFHKTKEEIRRLKSAILVEGQMDFLALFQEGIKNIIAVSGTALTADHLKAVRRSTDELVFCFDNDEAGFKAMERAIDLAGACDFNAKILILENYKDPGEMVLNAPEKLSDFFSKSKPAMEFYFNRYLAEVENSKFKVKSLDSKFDLGNFKKNIRIVLEKIKNLASPVEQAHWIKELSLKTKIEEKALVEEMAQLKILINAEKRGLNINGNLRDNPRQPALNRQELIAQKLISLIIIKDELKLLLEGYWDYFPKEYLLILKSLIEQTKLNDERLNNILGIISLRSSFEYSIIDEEKINAEFNELLKQLQSGHLKEKRQNLMLLIKEAEKKGEEEKIISALKEFDEVSRILQNISDFSM